ncbi:hypothetical protein FHW83_000640 [Duganella sp. SG902]|uniref:choice-of-anchor E domain-containing protein n=1 Tax=Duganella sp. SG902 TaxID=2587016 RepID=UPI00159D267B|nr:choice-of-anchor E domain-containing protein [Duganella sp. SG902]NVM74880.1 hypothetical protein [Duganella sp. SG902]
MNKFSKTIFAAAALTLAMGANAAVIEFTSNTAQNIEENDGELSFAKFNTALGTLTGVKFELFNVLSGSIEVTNDATTGAGTFVVTAGGQIESDVLGSVLTTSGSITKNFSLAAGQTGNVTLNPWTVSNSVSFNSSSDLSAFKGTGDYTALLTGWSSATSSGSGNATYNPIIVMDGYAKVTYTYDAAPVPEPETYAMLLGGLALMGVVARRRKSA